MKCQKDKFSLSDDVIYLNGAYMSPLLNSSYEAGLRGMALKRNPWQLSSSDFFDPVDQIRDLCGQLLDIGESNRIVVMPSSSYGLANVAMNLPSSERKKILIIEDQFPSNYYAWQPVVKDKGLVLEILPFPRAPYDDWTGLILDNLSEDILMISLPTVHWSDGSKIDLEEIGEKARELGVLLVVDGTQSIGALPFSQKKVQADAIVISSYKWLLGPYGMSVAYFGRAFDRGRPIEQSWLNRLYSDDFQYLTKYQDQYRAGARRYEVGEAPDFIKIPMLIEAVKQLLEWDPAQIQEYCKVIVEPVIEDLKSAGFLINDKNMAHHLFGIRLPHDVQMMEVKSKMQKSKISISYRGEVLRIAPSVYNTSDDLKILSNALLACRA